VEDLSKLREIFLDRNRTRNIPACTERVNIELILILSTWTFRNTYPSREENSLRFPEYIVEMELVRSRSRKRYFSRSTSQFESAGFDKAASGAEMAALKDEKSWNECSWRRTLAKYESCPARICTCARVHVFTRA